MRWLWLLTVGYRLPVGGGRTFKQRRTRRDADGAIVACGSDLANVTCF